MGIWAAFEFCVACLEIYLTQLFVTSFLKERKTINQKFRNVVFLLCVFINFCVDFFFYDSMVIITAATITLVFVMAVILCDSKLYWSILTAIGYLMICGISELLSVIIVTIPQKVVFSAVFDFNSYRFQAVIIEKILSFILIKLISRFRKGQIDKIPLKTFLALLVLPVSSVIIMLQITYNAAQNVSVPSPFTIISIVCLVCTNIIVFSLIEGIIRQAGNDKLIAVLEAQLEFQKEHIIQITQTHTQIRHMAHDFKQHTHTFQMLCETAQYGALSEALHKLRGEQSFTTLSIVTGNPMLDAILSAKKKSAEQNDILCLWQIEIPSSLPVNELDLCAILGNALDNSIEACLRTSGKLFITLELRVFQNNLLCRITNTMGDTPVTDGDSFISQKKQSGYHGIGLESMRRLCESLGGDMCVEFDSEVFEVRFLIPLMSSLM